MKYVYLAFLASNVQVISAIINDYRSVCTPDWSLINQLITELVCLCLRPTGKSFFAILSKDPKSINQISKNFFSKRLRVTRLN